LAVDSLTITVVTYLLPIVAAIHVGLGVYAFRFRKVPAAFPFGIAMFLAAIWAFALAMELVSGSLADKIFWSNIRIPATGMLAVTWLIMSIRHARLPWLNSRRIAALFIVPAITTTLLWTGVYSALYRYNFRLDVSGFFPTLIADTGPWYWVAGVAYGQAMIYASVILLLRSLRGAPSLYRRQTGMVILAGLVPVVLELVSQAVPRLRGGSFTPLVFAFTGALVAWGLFRYRMFDVVPVARDLVLENMSGLVFVVDGNSRVVDLNPAAQKAVGLEPLNVIGRTAEGVLRDWTGLPIGLESTEFAVGEMDKRRVYDMKVSPIKNSEGDVVGRLLLLHDITERKRMEEELRRHTEHLEELVEEKTKDLKLSQEKLLQAERLAAIGKTAGMVAHDLRNPLQGMTSVLYLAKQTLKSPKAAERQEAAKLLETLDEEVAYMGKIVEDLQDYARPLMLDLAETSLPDLIRETFSTMKVPRNIKVIVQVEKGIGNVMVDAGLMRRVLTNLTTNGIQSMPKGGRLTIRADKTRNVTVIAVEDTGVGISEEDLGKLFEPFFTTKAKGQGFGLPVCKRLVEAHGGTITAESKLGKGSTFTIKIRLNKKE